MHARDKTAVTGLAVKIIRCSDAIHQEQVISKYNLLLKNCESVSKYLVLFLAVFPAIRPGISTTDVGLLMPKYLLLIQRKLTGTDAV